MGLIVGRYDFAYKGHSLWMCLCDFHKEYTYM